MLQLVMTVLMMVSVAVALLKLLAMRKKNKHNEVAIKAIKDILINEISFGICY